MIGGALNTAAEQVVEYSAYGELLTVPATVRR